MCIHNDGPVANVTSTFCQGMNGKHEWNVWYSLNHHRGSFSLIPKDWYVFLTPNLHSNCFVELADVCGTISIIFYFVS